MTRLTKADTSVDTFAQILFEFEHSDDSLEKCDCCIAFGSHDPHVASHAAELYLKGLVNHIVFTGGFGRITSKTQSVTEAALYKDIAIHAGVPSEAIIIEEKASNTGENIMLTTKLLDELGLLEQRHIFVERPYRQARTRATLEVQWKQLDYLMTSPSLTYQDYCRFYETDGPITKSDFIALMVGDLQRILVYPSLGYQAEISVPKEVLEAYEKLVSLGYVSQMLTK